MSYQKIFIILPQKIHYLFNVHIIRCHFKGVRTIFDSIFFFFLVIHFYTNYTNISIFRKTYILCVFESSDFINTLENDQEVWIKEDIKSTIIV